MSAATGDPNTRTTAKVVVADEDNIPFDPDPVVTKTAAPAATAESKPAGQSNANDILSMIRARQSK